MDAITVVGIAAMGFAGLTITIGSIAPAIAQGRAIQQALTAMAQQPDVHKPLAQTLFVGLAMLESLAIYCFVIAMILIFANPFWNYVIRTGS
ncbi:MAG TPA: F0F1 ATP synthase subunit C [bacterium]|nr:F0F1 ATP synthase subunit C [bacterium]